MVLVTNTSVHWRMHEIQTTLDQQHQLG